MDKILESGNSYETRNFINPENDGLTFDKTRKQNRQFSKANPSPFWQAVWAKLDKKRPHIERFDVIDLQGEQVLLIVLFVFFIVLCIRLLGVQIDECI